MQESASFNPVNLYTHGGAALSTKWHLSCVPLAMPVRRCKLTCPQLDGDASAARGLPQAAPAVVTFLTRRFASPASRRDSIIGEGETLMPDYQTIFTEAIQLPVADRLRLIDELASTVPEDQPPQLSEQWLVEIERRAAELDSGAVKPDSWEEVHKRLLAIAESGGEA